MYTQNYLSKKTLTISYAIFSSKIKIKISYAIFLQFFFNKKIHYLVHISMKKFKYLLQSSLRENVHQSYICYCHTLTLPLVKQLRPITWFSNCFGSEVFFVSNFQRFFAYTNLPLILYLVLLQSCVRISIIYV